MLVIDYSLLKIITPLLEKNHTDNQDQAALKTRFMLEIGSTVSNGGLSILEVIPIAPSTVENRDLLINIFTVFILLGQEQFLERLAGCAEDIKLIKCSTDNHGLYAFCLLIAMLKAVQILDSEPILKRRFLNHHSLFKPDPTGPNPGFVQFDQIVVNIIREFYHYHGLIWPAYSQRETKLVGELKNQLRAVFTIPQTDPDRLTRREKIIIWLKQVKLSAEPIPDGLHFAKDKILRAQLVRQICLALYQSLTTDELVAILPPSPATTT